MPRCSVLLYGNHIQANMRILIVLGANNPTMMTAMPETTKETDRTVSGHPLRLCSKLRNSAFTLCRHFRCSVSVRHCPRPPPADKHPAGHLFAGRLLLVPMLLPGGAGDRLNKNKLPQGGLFRARTASALPRQRSTGSDRRSRVSATAPLSTCQFGRKPSNDNCQPHDGQIYL
jgi:hypothetical protein